MLVSGICHSVASRIAPHRLQTDVKPNAPNNADAASAMITTLAPTIRNRFFRVMLMRDVRAGYDPSSATVATKRADCNCADPPSFAAARACVKTFAWMKLLRLGRVCDKQ
jgi:hypothetical protein